MDIWAEVGRLHGKTLKTLDRGQAFDLVAVTDAGAHVRPHISDKERVIQRKEIEAAGRALVAKGTLSRTEIQQRYSLFNTAYVAAILAALPGVTHRVRPIELQYHNAKQQ
jgi:hypothetical protein